MIVIIYQAGLFLFWDGLLILFKIFFFVRKTKKNEFFFLNIVKKKNIFIRLFCIHISPNSKFKYKIQLTSYTHDINYCGVLPKLFSIISSYSFSFLRNFLFQSSSFRIDEKWRRKIWMSKRKFIMFYYFPNLKKVYIILLLYIMSVSIFMIVTRNQLILVEW